MNVVWLCHFASLEVKKYFSSPDVNETAPWINNLIDLFKDQSSVQLHVVAPNIFSNTDCSFQRDGVNYHFYKYVPIQGNNVYLRKIHNFLSIDLLTNFLFVRWKIRKIIKSINPDIIHLHGAENPYYSAGILWIMDEFPTIVTIQGFVRKGSDRSRRALARIAIEERILRRAKNIAIRTREMSDTAHSINPSAHLYFHNYPLTLPAVVKDYKKVSEYDIVYFARVTKDKGIEDLLEALAIVKEILPKVTLRIIGGASQLYQRKLVNLCHSLNIHENISFLGFLETQQHIFEEAVNASICVLPTYHDIIPGTIIESMYMKIPVVAYATGGIPELNSDSENVVLVERNNIRQLAQKIEFLLQHAKFREEIAERAYTYIRMQYNNQEVAGDVLQAYYSILQK